MDDGYFEDSGRDDVLSGGGHMAMYDDQVTYFNGIIDFIRHLEYG